MILHVPIIYGFVLRYLATVQAEVDLNCSNTILVDGKQENSYNNGITVTTDVRRSRVLLKYRNTTSGKVEVCSERQSPWPWYDVLYDSLACLSCGCNLLTMAVYLIVPTLRRSRPGKALVMLNLILFISTFSIIIRYKFDEGTRLCRYLGIIAHYCYLSSFFLMHVMALDYREHLAVNILPVNSTTLRQFIYIVVGAICPMIIVGSSVLFDEYLTDHAWAPHHGYVYCWLNSLKAYTVFFLSPVLVILVANIAISLYTIWKIRAVQTATNNCHGRRSIIAMGDLDRFRLFLKLVVIFGIQWLCTILGALFRIAYMYYAFLLIGVTQGVWIFYVVTCRKSVYREICNFVSRNRSPANSLPSRSKNNSVTPQMGRGKIDNRADVFTIRT